MYVERYLPYRKMPKIFLGDTVLGFIYNISHLAKILRLVVLLTLAIIQTHAISIFLAPFILLAGNLLIRYTIKAFNTDYPYEYLHFHFTRFITGKTIVAFPAIALSLTLITLGFYNLDFLSGKYIWLAIHVLLGCYVIIYANIWVISKYKKHTKNE